MSTDDAVAGRVIDLSVDVPGTPEEVWQAIATGPGVSSWFVPAELEGRVGGAVRHDFGEMGVDESGRVTAWDPPRRLVLEGHASTGGVLAFEWLVEARGGGTCTVRLVASGFGDGEEWDGDFDGMSGGWQLFLESLRLHLTHFPSSTATATAVPMAMVAGDNERAWHEVCAAFGVPSSVGEGDAVVLALGDAGATTWSGRVERVTSGDALRHCSFVLDHIRATGFLAAEGSGDTVILSAYLYFHGADAEADADRWRSAWSSRWSTAPS